MAAWQLSRGDLGQRRWIGLALLAGLLVKVLLEAPWLGALREVPGWDIMIAPLAHASGAAAGLLCALACGVGRDRRRPDQAAELRSVRG